jgi:hypothetical protein
MRKSEYEKIKALIVGILTKHLGDNSNSLWGDLVFKTPKEHSQVHEYLQGSNLVMWFDGSPVYEMLNYGTYGWGFRNDLDEALHNAGYYYELGHAWNLGVYSK